MKSSNVNYGIVGHKAPELELAHWVGADGKTMAAPKLSDYVGKFVVIYCFQAWCPGCHSSGFPALQKMTQAFANNERIVFLAIQTVFEGREANTYEKMTEIQQRYHLAIPFGHDIGNVNTNNVASTMYHYRTGGTPWYILIDQQQDVVFNDFHLNPDGAIAYLKQAITSL